MDSNIQLRKAHATFNKIAQNICNILSLENADKSLFTYLENQIHKRLKNAYAL